MAEQCTGRGARGVVCAAAPLAAQAGAEVLRVGGNAYDAAVTMALAEGVLLPPKCGLGGDLVALALDPGAAEPRALVAVGGAPARLAGVAAGAWRDVGPTSVGPPAAPAGYLALAELGRLPLERLAAPALALANDGFPWAAVATDLGHLSADLVSEMHPEGCVYFPAGRPIEPGTIVRLPGLAAALTELVERGHDVLAGPLGEAVVRAVGERGGVLDRDDLDVRARAEWLPCANGHAGPYRAWTTPAPTHGPALLAAVAGARPGDGAGDAYQRVLTAVAAARESLADLGGTSMVSAADEHGTVVVVVHSNSYPRFGSGIVVPEYDLVLNNRPGRGFTPVPGHPNFPVAGRRPATTLHIWMVADGSGRPRLAGGTPGGDNQMPWNAQTLGQVVAGCDRPGALVTSPRWEWLPADDGVRVEAGLGDGDVAALEEAAPRLVRRPRWSLKSAQQVVRVRRGDEAFEAAADPRTVGASLGV